MDTGSHLELCYYMVNISSRRSTLVAGLCGGGVGGGVSKFYYETLELSEKQACDSE